MEREKVGYGINTSPCLCVQVFAFKLANLVQCLLHLMRGLIKIEDSFF